MCIYLGPDSCQCVDLLFWNSEQFRPYIRLDSYIERFGWSRCWWSSSVHQQQVVERVNRKDPFQVYNEAEFRYRYRFSKQTTLELIDILSPTLARHTIRRDALPVHLQVLTASRFYAVGSFQILHGDDALMSQSSVSRVVLDVSTALATLRPRYIKFPRTPQEVLRVQQRFFDYSQFPGVIGAVDNTHVPIQNPGGEQAQRFINRKNTSSLNVQMICDCDGRILNAVA
eukprot:XP_785127.4 PREDICTED: putative nuclease HARBI1 [Strongylocentrotus purpuratus]